MSAELQELCLTDYSYRAWFTLDMMKHKFALPRYPQGSSHAWSQREQSRFIESVLMGIPTMDQCMVTSIRTQIKS